MSQYSMALFVVGGVIKLNKLTWLIWQTCIADEKSSGDGRGMETKREREREMREISGGNKVEQEEKQEMNEVLIELC